MDRYRQATAETVRRAADRWINHGNRVVVRFRPEPSERVEPAPLDRSIAPVPGPDPAFKVPAVATGRLPNGLEVLVVERPDLPLVTLALMSRSGSVTDPKGKEGRASLAFESIDKGTASRSAIEIEDALGALGVGFQASMGLEGSHLAFQALKRNLAPAMGIFAEIVRTPAYPEAAVAMDRQMIVAALAQEATNAKSVAANLAPTLIYGKGHPYGQGQEGLPATVAALTREDLLAFHDRFVRPDSSALVFAGAITLREALELAGTHFGDWSGRAEPIPPIPAASPLPGRVFALDRQDAPQTVILQVLPAPAQRSRDMHAIRLVNDVWGGGFQSRLNLNLREDKAFSYGVGSSLRQGRVLGHWKASGAVDSEKTSQAVGEFLKELALLSGAQPISEQELADAKTNRTRGYPQEFETLGSLVGLVGYLWLDEQPMARLQEDHDETVRTGLASVRAAVQEHLNPQDARLLLVGDRDRILAAARDLDLGPVVFLTAEGEFVPGA